MYNSIGEAEVDAARYRWLKTQARIEHRDGATNGTWRVTEIPAYDRFEKAAFDYKTFDGAVDHAMLSAGCRTPAPAESAQVKEAFFKGFSAGESYHNSKWHHYKAPDLNAAWGSYRASLAIDTEE